MPTMRLRNLNQNPSSLLRSFGVRVMESKPYVRMATKVDLNIRSLVLTGRHEFQTSRSFLYADSASPAL